MSVDFYFVFFFQDSIILTGCRYIITAEELLVLVPVMPVLVPVMPVLVPVMPVLVAVPVMPVLVAVPVTMLEGLIDIMGVVDIKVVAVEVGFGFGFPAGIKKIQLLVPSSGFQLSFKGQVSMRYCNRSIDMDQPNHPKCSVN